MGVSEVGEGGCCGGDAVKGVRSECSGQLMKWDAVIDVGSECSG